MHWYNGICSGQVRFGPGGESSEMMQGQQLVGAAPVSYRPGQLQQVLHLQLPQHVFCREVSSVHHNLVRAFCSNCFWLLLDSGRKSAGNEGCQSCDAGVIEGGSGGQRHIEHSSHTVAQLHQTCQDPTHPPTFFDARIALDRARMWNV